MSLSARIPSTAGTNLFVPALYSNKVIDAAKKDLVAWDAIAGDWRNDLVKGNILYIPKTNVVDAIEIVVNTKGAATNPLNTTGVTLTIDQWYQAPVDIDDMTMKQSQVRVESIAVEESAYAIKVIMDTSVCTLFSVLGGYSATAYGTDGQTLSDDILIYCMETLDEADVPRDGKRSLMIDPSAMADMIKIDKFVSAMYVQLGAVENGVVAKNHPIYGCSIRVTNNLVTKSVGSYACMLHAKAIASAAQIENAFVLPYPDLHTTRYSCDALWGVKVAQEYWGVPFYTRKT